MDERHLDFGVALAETGFERLVDALVGQDFEQYATTGTTWRTAVNDAVDAACHRRDEAMRARLSISIADWLAVHPEEQPTIPRN